MPSKLKKAIGAVKDRTSISLAKASNTNASNVEVLILKATRHDEAPIDERYVDEILQLIASSKVYAVACAQVISKRIGKTRNWIVALKSLMLVLRIFQDGDPYFPREVAHAMKKGQKILNLSNFRDDSNSSPWDYTAFVRTFALYLDERLDCFIIGKLHKRFSNRERRNGTTRRIYAAVCEMKPIMLLDRISNWQRLLDRAIGSKPTGAAKNNSLVQISLYAIVQESFDLYRDISDALALLLDSFFHLQYHNCVSAFQACVKASKQFEELCSFYDLCKSSGVGRTSEYPSVQKVSEELIETLQEFLKDQASFPAANGRSALMLPAPPTKDPGSSFDYDETWHYSSEPIERESEYGSQCASLEDLMSGGTSPSPSIEQLVNMTDGGTCPSPSHSAENFSNSKQSKLSQENDDNFAPQSVSNKCLPIEQSAKDMTSDILVIEGEEEQQKKEQNLALESSNGARVASNLALVNHLSIEQSAKNDWELVLAETATKPAEVLPAAQVEHNFVEKDSVPDSKYNPFLQDAVDLSSSLATVPATDAFSVAPTFQAMPTFSTQNPSQSRTTFENKDDPFGPCLAISADKHVAAESIDQKLLLQEQQLWLQNQNKIIAKHMA